MTRAQLPFGMKAQQLTVIAAALALLTAGTALALAMSSNGQQGALPSASISTDRPATAVAGTPTAAPEDLGALIEPTPKEQAASRPDATDPVPRPSEAPVSSSRGDTSKSTTDQDEDEDEDERETVKPEVRDEDDDEHDDEDETKDVEDHTDSESPDGD